MLKYDYFSVIEKMSDMTCDTLISACSKKTQKKTKSSENLHNIYELTYELERALFADFLPPLERDSIASYAHALCALADASLIYSSVTASVISPTTRFEALCCELCELLRDTSTMLKKAKKSSDIPKLDKFRELKKQAFDAHRANATSKSVMRSLQVSCAERELLSALSDTFETLVEVMLKNI